MALLELSLHNFRLYEQTTFCPDSRINLITGANACGKTTILEAIHSLGSGRSFRTNQPQQLVREGADAWLVHGTIGEQDGSTKVKIAVEQSRVGRQMAVGPNRSAKAAELAQQLPLLVISPDCHFDYQQHAKVRRSVLDWLLFHVEPTYHDTWARYQRTLAQRNAALKDPRQVKIRHAWDEELASGGDVIQLKRQAQLEALQADFETIAGELIGGSDTFRLRFRSGWSSELGLAYSLQSDSGRDIASGFTHSGPHRNDIEIEISGQPSHKKASHGQNKLLVIALRLAQIQKLYALSRKSCVLLIDDLPAELDAERRARLSHYFSALPVQVFATATDESLVDTSRWPSSRKFHVEHGQVKHVE